jgi:hypothetical protein
MAEKLRPAKKKCLLVIPFTDANGERAEYWEGFARELCDRVTAVLSESTCERVQVGAGPILETVIQRIVAADLIICDLTHLKPNVVFELGISQLLDKPTILLVQGKQRLPSDFDNIAYIPYELRGDSPVPHFPPNLFESTLRQIVGATVESLAYQGSGIRRSLASISCVLKHALQLEESDSVLAPVLRSLLDQLIIEHATGLTRFLEEDREAVTIKVDSPGILFDVLISLLGGLKAGDRYDSVTWRKHWLGENRPAAQQFLNAIRQRGHDLPVMRRIFLLGITARDEDGQWLIDREDLDALASYNELLGSHTRVLHRFLFLPARLVEPVADRCHMGKITREDSIVFVFSRYSKAGVLDSFEISRGNNLAWSYEELWNLSSEVPDLTWSQPRTSIEGKHLMFFGAPERIQYRSELRALLKRLGVPLARGFE